ncbi:MAG TPA: copper resistance protein B [Geminicoccaceae bacterium]|nr:copper resistance protein B [Geminicoccaceae bacterium]
MPDIDPGKAFLPALFALSVLLPGSAGAQVMDDELFTLLLIDQFEYRLQDGDDLLAWEGEGRIGNDRNKAVVKSEGEYLIDPEEFENAEFQLLYQRLISDFFDAQGGVRYDLAPGPSRAFAVFGVNGLAPGWFEVDASLFVSEEANVSVRLEADYDLLLTQRLVLQPAAELNLAFANDRDVDIASGLNDIELGLRLRYEILRELAPYVGVNWERKLGNTADLARDEGEDDDALAAVAGLRIFF